MQRTRKRTERVTLLVSAGAIVLIGLVGILLVWLNGESVEDPLAQWAAYPVELDKNCVSGPLEGKAAPADAVAYGSLRYQLNAAPWFLDCDAQGTVCFQNDVGNQHFVRISYVLDGGDEVYRSGMIPPDSHIKRAKLTAGLAAGVYEGVCRIELFDMDSLQVLGTLESDITITVAH
ncbi:MAG: hypothetical protein PHE47_05460 [Oscillospiraceae bacterium]|nr:hypothetical protein [Oscillospiraceae bacterium]